MPATHDLDPPALTEDERLAKRRYQAGHAFEQMFEPLDPNEDHDDLSLYGGSS